MDDLKRRFYLLKNRGDVSLMTVPEEIDHTIHNHLLCCGSARARAERTTNKPVIIIGSGLTFAYDDIPCDCPCHVF